MSVPPELVADIVVVLKVPAEVGVPEITPVVVLIVKPDGKLLAA